MIIDVSLKDCESNIDTSFQSIQCKLKELKMTIEENEKINEVLNKDYISINPKRYCILKNKEDKITSITVFGVINDCKLSTSIPAYEMYLSKKDNVFVVVYCKLTINKILRKIIKNDNFNKNEILMIQVENNFFYKLNTENSSNYDEDNVNINNKRINKCMIVISTAIKLYIAYFNKFKSQKEIIYSIISNDEIEKMVCNVIFDYCGFINSNKSDNSEIINKQNDLLLIMSGEVANNSKKNIFTSMDSNSIISLCSNNLQLDPPDIQYLSKMNITINFFEIESFLNNMLCLGSFINFLDDLLNKISFNDFNYNRVQLEVKDFLFKLKEIGNGSNLKQNKNDVSSEEITIISFMNILNDNNSDIEKSILILY